jgi:hypothetical protein
MKTLLLVAGLLVLFGYPSVAAYEAVEPDLAWVAKSFVGGRQCEPASKYDPPDVKQLLGRAGIATYETRIERLLVCAACSCPSYAATYYALIQRNEIDNARQMGFLPKQPPESH